MNHKRAVLLEVLALAAALCLPALATAQDTSTETTPPRAASDFRPLSELPDKPVPQPAGGWHQRKEDPQQPQPTARVPGRRSGAEYSHRFWDKQNAWLFAGVGAVRVLDFTSTQNFRRRGRDEVLLTNEIVDNEPLFAVIEAGAWATSVGISYVFHRTNHHKLERWTSYLHIGIGGFGAVRNYCLKTNPNPAHPEP